MLKSSPNNGETGCDEQFAWRVPLSLSHLTLIFSFPCFSSFFPLCVFCFPRALWTTLVIDFPSMISTFSLRLALQKKSDICSIVVKLCYWYGTEFIKSLSQADEDYCIFKGLVYVYIIAVWSRKIFFKLKRKYMKIQNLQSFCRWDRTKRFVKLSSTQIAAWMLDICGLKQKAVRESSLQTTEIASLQLSHAEIWIYDLSQNFQVS